MSPRVKPRPSPAATRSSYAEFRQQKRDPWTPALGLDDTVFRDGDGVFWKYLCSPASVTGGDQRLFLSREEQRVLSKATNGAGAYLVPTDFGAEITSLRRAGSVIGQAVRELETPTGQTLQLGTATAHGTGAWLAESGAFTATDDTFGQVSIGAFKATTLTIVSEELLADSGPALDAYLAAELAGRLVALEEAGFAVGDGSGKPLGIVHTTSGYTVVTAATGSAAGFKAADVLAAVAALPDAYQPRASWLMSPSAYRSLASLADSAGGLIFAALQAPTPSLYGAPVYVSGDMPAVAANARSVVYGDLDAAYTVRRVTGYAVNREAELFSNNGQVGYRLFWRVDGRPVDLSAAIVLRNSAT